MALRRPRRYNVETKNLSINALKVHPRNQEFFDDISGDQFDRFKKSIEDEGIMTPLLVANDMTVISGHQRLKAATELGLTTVPVIIDETPMSDDDKLRKLLVANFGRSKNDPVKQGKVVTEYERLNGIRIGRPEKLPQTAVIKQSDIAKEFGVSVDTLQRLKQLTLLIPEVQLEVSSDNLKYTVATSVFSKLSPEEQRKLLKFIGKENIGTLSGREIEELKAEYEGSLADITDENTMLRRENQRLAVAKTTELESMQKQLDTLRTQKDALEAKASLDAMEATKYQELQRQTSELVKQKDTLVKQLNAIDDVAKYMARIEHLIEGELAPTRYSKAIFDLSSDQTVMENLGNTVSRVESWVTEMKALLNTNYTDAEVM
jgi:ParB family transcriptional regulator, chromosome partitioning protein